MNGRYVIYFLIMLACISLEIFTAMQWNINRANVIGSIVLLTIEFNIVPAMVLSLVEAQAKKEDKQ